MLISIALVALARLAFVLRRRAAARKVAAPVVTSPRA